MCFRLIFVYPSNKSFNVTCSDLLTSKESKSSLSLFSSNGPISCVAIYPSTAFCNVVSALKFFKFLKDCIKFSFYSSFVEKDVLYSFNQGYFTASLAFILALGSLVKSKFNRSLAPTSIDFHKGATTHTLLLTCQIYWVVDNSFDGFFSGFFMEGWLSIKKQVHYNTTVP